MAGGAVERQAWDYGLGHMMQENILDSGNKVGTQKKMKNNYRNPTAGSWTQQEEPTRKLQMKPERIVDRFQRR